MTIDQLFAILCQRFGVEPDRRGEAHVECPACGHVAVRGKVHFSFSVRGAKCFSCGWRSSLAGYADRVLAGDLPAVTAAQAMPRPSIVRPWQHDPERWVRQFRAVPERYWAWQRYKGLTPETVDRWELGAGILPSCACQHGRLIYPVRVDGRVVALRGRAVSNQCTCAKWLQSAGSQVVLWNADGLRPGATVIVAEKPPDGMLAMQVEPSVVCVAGTGGAGTWRPEWAAAIARSRPAEVLVWLDADLPGQAGGELRRRLIEAWRATWREKHPDREAPKPPEAHGPRIVDSIREAGVRSVTLYRWPDDTPPKADLAWALAGGVA